MNNGIQKLFSQVPKTYESINHLLTFGLDIVWRKRTARLAAKEGGSRWLDVCCGTGEMADYLRRKAPRGTVVYATDFTMPMLKEALAKPKGEKIKFVLSDVKTLPYPEKTFDLMTISFATRNINLSRDILIQTFSEFHRVLRPNGLFYNLETSQPGWTVIKSLFHLYIARFVRSIGSRISGSKAAYTYLSRTIPRFYTAEELEEILRQAGFHAVDVKKMLFGVAAIHRAQK